MRTSGQVITTDTDSIHVIGSGGTGARLACQSHGLRRPVAIKFQHVAHSSSDAALRFRREARLAARLRSPFTVKYVFKGAATTVITKRRAESVRCDHHRDRQ